MKAARLIIRERYSGVTVSITETTQERMRGLLGRDGLVPNEALLLRSCRSVHTFGMRFAIDVVFLDRHNRIVAIRHDVPKRRMHFSMQATQTLEMAAGVASLHRLKVGDQLVFGTTP